LIGSGKVEYHRQDARSTEQGIPISASVFARCVLNMFQKVLNLLSFGCRHAHISVPFSMDMARQRQARLDWAEELPPSCSHYVVCLDCGRHFGYDWSTMKMIKPRLKPTA
jgi:hypothetical protein